MRGPQSSPPLDDRRILNGGANFPRLFDKCIKPMISAERRVELFLTGASDGDLAIFMRHDIKAIQEDDRASAATFASKSAPVL